jgi:hypothetical protein
MIFIARADTLADLAKPTGNPANNRKASNGEVFRGSALEELRISATSQVLAEVDVKILFEQWADVPLAGRALTTKPRWFRVPVFRMPG